MGTKRKGISVLLFSVIWLTVTVGMVLLMLNSRRDWQQRIKKPIMVKEDEKKASFHEPHTNRELWSSTPLVFEGETTASSGDKAEENINSGFVKEDLPKEALDTLENLCKFLCEGGMDNLSAILPQEYLDTLINKYAPLTNLFGGEDAAIKYVLKLKFGSIIEKIGEIEHIDYEIKKTKRLEGNALIELEDKYKDLDWEVQEAYIVKLKLLIYGKKGETEEAYTLTVLNADGSWYINPDGLPL